MVDVERLNENGRLTKFERQLGHLYLQRAFRESFVTKELKHRQARYGERKCMINDNLPSFSSSTCFSAFTLSFTNFS